MNLLVLATLFSMVWAEKSPRLKFTVNGKTLFVFNDTISVCITHTYFFLWKVLDFSKAMFILTLAQIVHLIFPWEKKKLLRIHFR